MAENNWWNDENGPDDARLVGLVDSFPWRTSPPGGDGGQAGGEVELVRVTRLYDCQPDPFSEKTAIGYQLGEAGNVRLAVHDASGRLIRVLLAGEQKPGRYRFYWDGTDDRGYRVANGIYFYRLDAPEIGDVKKAVLMR